MTELHTSDMNAHFNMSVLTGAISMFVYKPHYIYFCLKPHNAHVACTTLISIPSSEVCTSSLIPTCSTQTSYVLHQFDAATIPKVRGQHQQRVKNEDRADK